MPFVSHIRIDTEGQQVDRPLADHLRAVATLASLFAGAFQAEEWAAAAGLWHDLGKFQARWQQYLQSHFTGDPHDAEAKSPTPHALAGAQYAERMLPDGEGRLLAYLIAGHHAGLPDLLEPGGLRQRLDAAQRDAKCDELMAALANREHIPAEILEKPTLAPDPTRMGVGGSKGEELALSLWLRMLFSCLVDADFLDAESFLNPEQYAARPKPRPAAELLPAFDAHMAGKARDAKPSSVNDARAQVLAACRMAGRAPRVESGLYSLTVPTGGGKTLASLAFALEHARTHGKQRVIYAIPFTSIIEQTAAAFRSVFPVDKDEESPVLEHHSNLDLDTQPRNAHLATENWDAPLIVTTNVQLFESLFASRTSRCRKLHNLVNSVIVLDEAQQLPPAYLTPITQVLRLLAKHYGVTVLLCTATQPNLKGQTDAFGRTAFPGIGKVREVIADPSALYAKLKRVEVKLPLADATRLSWDVLAADLHQHDSVLAIVSTRNDARALYAALGEDSGRLHLSARMCAEHRVDVIAQIKQRLQARRDGQSSETLRVVSTTLVEAGVDLDFPVVYRALAGLDSIAQAAGRCNREGRLQGLGKVIVFRPEQERGRGLMKDAREVAAEMLDDGDIEDALAPQTFADYFRLLYARAAKSRSGLDAKGIVRLLTPSRSDCAISFRTAAAAFQLVEEEGQQTVIVRYTRDVAQREVFEQALGALSKDPTQKWAYRRLQRYSVSVPENEFRQMEAMQMLEPVGGLFVVRESWYDPAFGLRKPDEGMAPASSVF
jgi:CRISPR-associated endonuclease/helicase Cas3